MTIQEVCEEVKEMRKEMAAIGQVVFNGLVDKIKIVYRLVFTILGVILTISGAVIIAMVVG